MRATDKRLLQAAAVVGKDVPLRTAAGRGRGRRRRLASRLGHLKAAEFLYEASLFPDPEYTFKHALTHEVAYGSLLHDRRRALHARIVGRSSASTQNDWTSRSSGWPTTPDVARCDQAVTYLRQAGYRAAARSAHREAIPLFEQALAVLGERPDTRRR